MDRLSKYKFRDKNGLPLENNPDWQNIINDLKYHQKISQAGKFMIDASTVISDDLYDIIQKDDAVKVDQKLLCKAMMHLDIKDYVHRLLALDCIKKGMMLGQIILVRKR